MTRARLAALLPLLAACTVVPGPDLPALPTASPRAPSVVFAVKGDWGAGTPEQRAVTARMCAARRATPFRDVLTTGDNFYRPDGTATERTYGRPEACLAGVTWRATWGNHDLGGRSTKTVLRAERFYAWSAGGVDFFALDSNRAGDGTQRRWLSDALAASRARVKVVYFHHPPFTAGGHAPNQTVRRMWVPLFERARVTLVLSGHNHDYEHLVVSGIHYVVTGGGGATLTPCIRPAAGLRRCASESHFLLVRAQGGTVEVRAIRADGQTLDRFEIAV